MKGLRLLVGRPAAEPEPGGGRSPRSGRLPGATRSLRILAPLRGSLDAQVVHARTQTPAGARQSSFVLRPGDILVLASDHRLVLASSPGQGDGMLVDLALFDGPVAPCQHDRPDAFLGESFDGPAIAYRFAVDDETAAEFLRATRVGGGCARGIPDAKRILARIDHEQRQLDRFTSCAVAACTIELVVLIAREASTTAIRSEVMEAVETRLRSSTDRRLTLAELASMSGLNPSYLSRRYREVYGESPIAHHTRLRLEHAASLIDAGSTVTEAAAASGFRTVYHFSSSFKKHFGVPPSDYRRRTASRGD